MNNKIYLYDGDYVSLLNLIYKLYNNKIIPRNIKTSDYNKNLFEEVIELNIDKDMSVLNKIINIFGEYVFNTIYKVFLSDNLEKEIIIYHFLYYAYKYKNKVYYMRNIKAVNEALKIEKYVNSENHKYKGFVRFKELNNKVLYALISPSNNILPILVNHFKKRLEREYWVIKDVKRNIYAIYDKVKVYIIDGSEFTLKIEGYSSEEKEIEDMWVSFYKTIGIKSRRNERCRMNFMPKKYWKYITEVSEEL